MIIDPWGVILAHITDDLCSPTQDDLAWHGACLALAEFTRRGYVRIGFMGKVVEVVEKALFYEHIKGKLILDRFWNIFFYNFCNLFIIHHLFI